MSEIERLEAEVTLAKRQRDIAMAEVDEVRALLSTANYQRDNAIQQLAGIKMQLERLRMGKRK